MNQHQFIQMIQSEDFSQHMEALYERCAEIEGEIARFGDSGPGSLFRLRQSLDQVKKQKAQYERLSGCTFPYQIPSLPHPR
jgi:hypothetical protein